MHPKAEVDHRTTLVVVELMLNGYVGIVSQQGLCQIQVEGREAMLHVHRAATLSQDSPRVGFWAILPTETACYIAGLVDRGEGKEALRVLNQTAREGGHLLPFNQ